ncbi:hypothetical protein TIFTF001_056568, partial [Ficus carica]
LASCSSASDAVVLNGTSSSSAAAADLASWLYID